MTLSRFKFNRWIKAWATPYGTWKAETLDSSESANGAEQVQAVNRLCEKLGILKSNER